MTQASDDTAQKLDQVLTEVRSLKQDVKEFSQNVKRYNEKVEQFNDKFDNYKKATQWVVQLAFSLIAAATVTVLVSTVLGR